MDIFIDYDPASLAKIKNILGFNTALLAELEKAMADSLRDLRYHAESYMYAEFQNPEGRLEDAFEEHVYGPFTSELINPLPYAWRRNEGFTGMTDSIGRTYSYDPGIRYMQEAIDAGYDDVQLNFEVALDNALRAVGA
jgi:hypothetical protein